MQRGKPTDCHGRSDALTRDLHVLGVEALRCYGYLRPERDGFYEWHPIEHRLFSHVERALRGVMLDSPETALRAVERTRTETGLRVTARLLDKVYDIGRKCGTLRGVWFLNGTFVSDPKSRAFQAEGRIECTRPQ